MPHVIPAAISEHDDVDLIERPDGFYWQPKGEARQYGPFASFAEALADIDSRAAPSPESVAEAESELGVSDWIDDETGEPAEDNARRLEQH
ncbi:MAG: hypothetical protein ACM3Y9_00345 [Ignavibacteria bacterium]